MSHIIFNDTGNEYMNSNDNLIGALELQLHFGIKHNSQNNR